MKCRIGLLFKSAGISDITPPLDDATLADLIERLNRCYGFCELLHVYAFSGEMVVWYKVF